MTVIVCSTLAAGQVSSIEGVAFCSTSDVWENKINFLCFYQKMPIVYQIVKSAVNALMFATALFQQNSIEKLISWFIVRWSTNR